MNGQITASAVYDISVPRRLSAFLRARSRYITALAAVFLLGVSVGVFLFRGNADATVSDARDVFLSDVSRRSVAANALYEMKAVIIPLAAIFFFGVTQYSPLFGAIAVAFYGGCKGITVCTLLSKTSAVSDFIYPAAYATCCSITAFFLILCAISPMLIRKRILAENPTVLEAFGREALGKYILTLLPFPLLLTLSSFLFGLAGLILPA